MNTIKRFPLLHAISDLHVEFRPNVAEFYESLGLPNADVLVLAGDVGVAGSTELHDFLDLAKKQYPEVVMVPGNHEYYNSNRNRNRALQSLRQACVDRGVHLLQRGSVLLGDVWFHGTTLWSAIDSGVRMNDLEYVFEDRVDYLEEFVTDYQWLRRTLNEKDHEQKHVVITHHLPTTHLIHPRYSRSDSNTGFATNVLDKMVLRGVQYWFCGHTHEYSRVKYGDTHLIVNPVGYPKEPRRTSTSKDVHVTESLAPVPVDV
jgi:predicted phosphodiesterase